jgi:ABC-2 type transport system permease protein
MTPLAAMVAKEWKLLLRDPGALALLFVMPSVFILVFSLTLQGVFSSGGEDERMDVLVVDEDAGPVGDRIARALEESGHFRVAARGREFDPEISVVVRAGGSATIVVTADPIVPEAIATAVVSIAEAVVLILAVEELERTIDDLEDSIGGMEGGMEELAEANRDLLELVLEQHGHLEKAVRLMPPSLRTDVSLAELDERRRELEEDLARAGGTPEPGGRPARAAGPGLTVELKYSTAGGGEIQPTSVQQNVPGWTIFGLFWIAQTLALSILAERASGAYKRILVAPVSFAGYLAGKAVPYLAVNLVQALFMFGIGVWILPLFGAPRLGIPDVPAAMLLTLCVSVCAISFGLFMASLSRSALLIGSVSAVALVVMTALAGIMVPRFIMPEFMQTLALCVPQGWALDGFHDILVRGLGIRGIVPHIGILAAFSAAFFLFALVRMRLLDRAR